MWLVWIKSSCIYDICQHNLVVGLALVLLIVGVRDLCGSPHGLHDLAIVGLVIPIWTAIYYVSLLHLRKVPFY